MSMILDGSNGVTFNDSSLQGSAASPYVLKNRIINGAMQVWQRGTSFTNTANTNQYTADRWAVFSGVGLPATSAQVSTGLSTYQYALRVQRPNGNTSTSNTAAIQVIETINCYDLAGQTVTLSFWARAGSNYSPTGNLLGVLVNTGSGTDQGVTNLIASAWTSQANTTTNVTLTTSFQKFTFTTTIPSGTNEIGLYFITNPTGTAGANDYFDVTGVQLEQNTSATPFERRLYNQELANCQRYYFTTQIYIGALLGGQSTTSYVNYPTPMRVSPTIAGGGSGFATITPTVNAVSVYQSSASSPTLTFVAEL